MKDYSGISPATLPDPKDTRFVPRVRSMLNDVDIYLREISRGMARIQQGQIPDGSGTTIVPPTSPTLDDYLYMPGRVGGQTVYGNATSNTDGNATDLRLYANPHTSASRITMGGTGMLLHAGSAGTMSVRGDTITFYSTTDGSVSGLTIYNTYPSLSYNTVETYGINRTYGLATIVNILNTSSLLQLNTGITGPDLTGDIVNATPSDSTGYNYFRVNNLGHVGVQVASSGSFASTAASLTVTTKNAGRVVQLNKAAAAQTADLLRFEDSSAALLSRVKSDGAWEGPIASTGSVTFSDSTFRINDNTTPTKQLAFECSGISAATTRTVTIPDASGTLAFINTAQTFTAAQTIEPSGDTQPLAIVGTNVATADLFSISITGSAAKAMLVSAAGAVNYAGTFTVWSGDIGTTNDATFDATSVSGSTVLTIPSISSTLAVLGGTQTFTGSKTFSGTTTISGLGSVLRSSTATSGVRFGDNTDTTKALRMVLSGCSTGADNSFTFVSTADRNYGYQDLAGTVPIVGDDAPAVASGALGKVDLTGQTAAIGSTNLSSTPPAGVYAVEVYAACTTASGAGAPTLDVTIGWTDVVGATTANAAGLNGTTFPLSLAATGRAQARFVIQVASGDIAYSTTINAAAGTPAYAIYIRVVALG